MRKFKIESIGRKWIAAKLISSNSEYDCKILLNESSNALKIGDIIEINCRDVSDRNQYGVQLKFEPITKADEKNAEAEKWLKYAEKDAEGYSYSTNAIERALNLCKDINQFKLRLDDLKERLMHNKEYWKRESEKEKERYHASRKKDVMSPVFKRKILFPCSNLPEIGVPFKFQGSTIVIEGYGEKFRINDDHPSLYGSHLLGYEGEMGCYGYYK